MLFVTSLADFDQIMSPDELRASGSSTLAHVNRMKDSLDLFNTLINWKTSNSKQKEVMVFENISIILFLNKKDLFEKKYEERNSAIKQCFDDYDEDISLEESREFIARKFVKCNKSKMEIYYHYTYALDTKHVEAVVSVVRDTILQRIATDSALF